MFISTFEVSVCVRVHEIVDTCMTREYCIEIFRGLSYGPSTNTMTYVFFGTLHMHGNLGGCISETDFFCVLKPSRQLFLAS